MALLCNFLLVISWCCGFASEKPGRYETSQLIGKWKYSATYCNGKPDSTANSVADYYFVFNAGHSFDICYRNADDTTLYTMPGHYHTKEKKGRVNTRCRGTVTRYTVQKVTANELVLVNKGNDGRMYTTYFIKEE